MRGWPISFGNPWKDSGALCRLCVLIFSLQHQRKVQHRICVVRGGSQNFTQAVEGSFKASLLIKQVAKRLV